MSQFSPLCFASSWTLALRFGFVSLLFCCVLCKSLILSSRFVHRSRSEKETYKMKKTKQKRHPQFPGTVPSPEGTRKQIAICASSVFLSHIEEKSLHAVPCVLPAAVLAVWTTNIGKKSKWNQLLVPLFPCFVVAKVDIYLCMGVWREDMRDRERER